MRHPENWNILNVIKFENKSISCKLMATEQCTNYEYKPTHANTVGRV